MIDRLEAPGKRECIYIYVYGLGPGMSPPFEIVERRFAPAFRPILGSWGFQGVAAYFPKVFQDGRCRL